LTCATFQIPNNVALAHQTGQLGGDPVNLIVPVLESLIATDRGFAKARRRFL
jgi:hypothetical protein